MPFIGKQSTSNSQITNYTTTVGSGGQTNFTVVIEGGDETHVYLNGVLLKETTDYTVSSTQVSLVSPAVENDIVEIKVFRSFALVDAVKATGGTFSGDVAYTGNIQVDDIIEKTSAHGVEIEGVLLKDSIVQTDDIQEKTSAHGVEIDGVTLKDGGGTFTGDLTVDTNTLKADSANNQVLVGKTTNSMGTAGTAISTTLGVRATVDGNIGLLINRLTSDGNLIDFRKDSTTVGVIGTSNSYLYIGEGDVGLAFRGYSDYILPWNPSTNSTRDDAINIGDSAYRFRDLYLSGGVFLGGTSGANKISDYEEGDWTPAPYNATSATFSSAVGKYTKIGRLVNAAFSFQVSSNSDTNIFGIQGLPFNIGSTEGHRGSIAHGWQDSGNDYVSNGNQTSSFFFIYKNDGNSWLFSNWSNKYLKGTFIYQV